MKNFILILLFTFSVLLFSNDYEDLLNDYESLLNDYESLLNDYEILNNEFINLTLNFQNLNEKYLNEIYIHKTSRYMLKLALETIEDFQDLNKKGPFAIIPKIGFSGDKTIAGLGISMIIPKLPISIVFDADLLYFNTPPFSFKIGIGYHF